jgi:hypothetical protein
MQASQDDLLERLATLEATLRRMQRRRRETHAASGIAMLAVLAGLTLGANGSSAPASQSIVRAPFQIVGAGGQTLLSVTEGAPGSGKLEMKGGSGKSFTVGITDKGDAFGRWDAATGSAYIGAPPGKDFGVRLYAAGGNTATVAMSESGQSAIIALGLHGIPKLLMRSDSTSARIGVLDDSGTKYLSNLTTHGSGGGDLELANASGQVVAFMDANPNNSEGRAVFTNAGGEPLAKIGASGPHGDVLLFGPNKSVPVWEMALTGMMR